MAKDKTGRRLEKAKAKAALLEAQSAASSAASRARIDAIEADARSAPLAQEQREAEARKAIAEADKAAALAARDRVSALLPDLSTAARQDLEVAGEGPVFANSLAVMAVERAAVELVGSIKALFSAGARVLLSGDTELAASHSTYRNILAGLDRLVAAADECLGAEEAEINQPAGALAGLAPSLLNALDVKRTVSGHAAEVDDLTAAAAVAGQLNEQAPGAAVVHDEFRLAPNGVIRSRIDDVAERRRALVARRAQLSADGAPEAVVALGRLGALVEAIDDYLTSIQAVPDGALRSPLSVATMREGLEGGGASPFSHVLLVKGNGSSIAESVNNKFLRTDTLAILATASITYMLLDARTGELVRSGNSLGSVSGSGKIGDTFSVSFS